MLVEMEVLVGEEFLSLKPVSAIFLDVTLFAKQMAMMKTRIKIFRDMSSIWGCGVEMLFGHLQRSRMLTS